MNLRLPLVSVIMNCHNGERYLAKAIESVYSQTYLNWEIIFFDNVSTDLSESIAKAYGSKIKYFYSNKKLSLGEARNHALNLAKGEIICFLDTDDIWEPTKLERQIAIFEQFSNIDFIYTNYFMLDNNSGKKKKGIINYAPAGFVFRKFLRHYIVNLQTVAIRSKVIKNDNGYFDPRLEVSEEYDLFMRILYKSEAYYLDEILVTYRVHNEMSSIKNLNKYPIENKYILDKLKKIIPNFDKEYKSEISFLEAKIGYWTAVGAIESGNRKKARKELRVHLWKSPIFIVLYLGTFFPRYFWNLRRKFRWLIA